MKNGLPAEEQRRLILRCQLGEQSAWEPLVHHWHPKLWRFIFRMCGERGRAEDVLQNAWLRIVGSLIKLRDPTKFEPWVYRIARLTIVDQLRLDYRQLRTQSLEFNDPACELDESFPLEILVQTEELESALGGLPLIDREVVLLFYFEQRSIQEISDICCIPEGTAKSRLFRARKQLKQALSPPGAH